MIKKSELLQAVEKHNSFPDHLVTKDGTILMFPRKQGKSYGLFSYHEVKFCVDGESSLKGRVYYDRY